LIAFRINRSAVVGIILAGIVVGPSLLNWIAYTAFVSSLSNLGAVILLFTIGLDNKKLLPTDASRSYQPD
jgi:Kef-type K+ transport system membrane component KefB